MSRYFESNPHLRRFSHLSSSRSERRWKYLHPIPYSTLVASRPLCSPMEKFLRTPRGRPHYCVSLYNAPNWQRNGNEALQSCVIQVASRVLTSVDKTAHSLPSLPDGSPTAQWFQRISNPETTQKKIYQVSAARTAQTSDKNGAAIWRTQKIQSSSCVQMRNPESSDAET